MPCQIQFAATPIDLTIEADRLTLTHRPRRLRKTETLQRMVRENQLKR